MRGRWLSLCRLITRSRSRRLPRSPSRRINADSADHLSPQMKLRARHSRIDVREIHQVGAAIALLHEKARLLRAIFVEEIRAVPLVRNMRIIHQLHSRQLAGVARTQRRIVPLIDERKRADYP